jgi:hypothetical protein
LNPLLLPDYNHRLERKNNVCEGDLKALSAMKCHVNSDDFVLDCCQLAEHFPFVSTLHEKSKPGQIVQALMVNGTMRRKIIINRTDTNDLFQWKKKIYHEELYNVSNYVNVKKSMRMWFIPQETRDRWSSLSGMKLQNYLTQKIPNLNEVEINNDNVQSGNHMKNLRSLRVIEFNAERGKHWRDFASMIMSNEELSNPDIIILNEMDIGMARSNNSHTTALLAKELKMNFIWGLEFVELTRGTEKEQYETSGNTNLIGLHGNAILSKYPILNGSIIRSKMEGSYFSSKATSTNAWGYEKRLGARMILFATIIVQDHHIQVGSTHKVHPSIYGQIIQKKSSLFIVGGDEKPNFCQQIGLDTVDNVNHKTWPASCKTNGSIRGDIICANLAVDKVERVIRPCFMDHELSDHAIKVVDLAFL